jgi:soluble lytic murein transglycosylase
MPSSRHRFLFLLLTIAVAGAAIGLWLVVKPTPWDDEATLPPALARALDRFDEGDLEAGLAETRRFLRRWRAPAWEDRARVVAGLRLAAAGRESEIPGFLPAAFDPGSPLAAHAGLLRARGLLALGRFEEAASAAEAAAAEGFPSREEAIRIQAAGLEAAGLYSEAIRALDRSSSPALRLEAAGVALRIEQMAEARRRLAHVALDPAAVEASSRALAALRELPLGATDRFSPGERTRLAGAARARTAAGRPDLALELLRLARPEGVPPSQVPASEALAEAEALLRLRHLAEVPPWLAAAATGPPEASDGALYLRARLERARGRASAYRASLAMLARRPGTTPWRLQALLDLARLAEGRPTAAARGAYRRYREVAGESADPDALWRGAWIDFELGRFSDFERASEKVLERADAPAGVRAAALYWTAVRFEASGRPSQARERLDSLTTEFGNSYYGLRAAQRLGRTIPPPIDSPIGRAPPPDSPAAARWLEAARALLSVREQGEAWSAFRAAAQLDPGTRRAVALEAADAALGARDPQSAAAFARLATGPVHALPWDALPLRHWRILYPLPRGGVLFRLASEAGLDPHLVAGVALQESGFNPMAVSSAGARGLLQLMPATGTEVARRLGIRGFDPDGLFEPELNLRLGTAHLRRLIDRFGDAPRALAAYNGGPAAVARWTIPSDERDPERFLERIPIPETRSYAKRVLAHAEVYRHVWPEPGTGS